MSVTAPGTHWASAPASSGPTASPPMLAIVATMPERRLGTPSGPASRSAMYAVAVATLAPSARPVSRRATSRPGSEVQTRKTIEAAAATSRPGISTVRRP